MKLSLLSLLVAALLMGAATAYAAEVGAVELTLLEDIFTGNIGTALGLLVAIVGIYNFAANGDTKGGVILVLLGVLITLLPGIFNGIRLITCGVVEGLDAHCGEKRSG